MISKEWYENMKNKYIKSMKNDIKKKKTNEYTKN